MFAGEAAAEPDWRAASARIGRTPTTTTQQGDDVTEGSGARGPTNEVSVVLVQIVDPKELRLTSLNKRIICDMYS